METKNADVCTIISEFISSLGPKGGEQHFLAGEGVGEDPIRTTGNKAWHSVYSVIVGF
jgi:hypothetical protein